MKYLLIWWAIGFIGLVVSIVVSDYQHKNDKFVEKSTKLQHVRIESIAIRALFKIEKDFYLDCTSNLVYSSEPLNKLDTNFSYNNSHLKQLKDTLNWYSLCALNPPFYVTKNANSDTAYITKGNLELRFVLDLSAD